MGRIAHHPTSVSSALQFPDRRLSMAAILLSAGLLLSAMLAQPPARVSAETSDHYAVVLAGEQGDSGFQMSGGALDLDAARTLVAAAGGSITNDLSAQIGVLFVAGNAAVADTLRASELVEAVGSDFSWKQYSTHDEATASGEIADLGYEAETSADLLEPLQWDMQMIRTEQAHATQAGVRAVDVGILDTGIDGFHPDFLDLDGGRNVACERGRNSIGFLPGGPGLGHPDPCIDNGFHGTHVAGTVGAQANAIGIVGVAPGVTLVPVKVCDTSGHCYASAVVDGITYSGDERFDVINMSFFVDDNEFLQSTEFKCNDDETQRAFRKAVERAVSYARTQGVAPVAALGNSDEDLAHPESGNHCDVVPAETTGVIGTGALGRSSEKARYSNYGTGAADVVAPGGNGTTGDCTSTILSLFPVALGAYNCIQGTSMASPHAAGVAALIVSQYGRLGADGDVDLSPQKVESLLQGTAIDIGLSGYDECFGNGRIDALRAVTGNTSAAYDDTAPFCPEYEE